MFRQSSIIWLFLSFSGVAAQTTFDVTQYGVTPRGSGGVFVDAGAGVRSLLGAIAAGTGPAAGTTAPYTLLFPGVPGSTTIYDFTTTAASGGYTAHLPISRSFTALVSPLDDLTITGDPSNPVEFRFHDNTKSGVNLIGNRGVAIRSLRLAYETPPFVQGVVDALGQNNATSSWMEITVDPGFQLFNLSSPTADPRVAFAKNLMSFDPTTREFRDNTEQIGMVTTATFAGGPATWIYQPDPVGKPRSYRFLVQKTDFAPNNPNGYYSVVGDLAVWKSALGVAMTTRETSDGLIDDVTIHNSGGAGFFTSMDLNLRIENCCVIPAQGALLSSCYCGVHAKDSRAGLSVRGCIFEGTGDDGVAIAGNWFEVIAQPPGLNYAGIPNAIYMRARSRLQFRDPASTYTFEFRDAGTTAVPRFGLKASGIHPTQIQFAGTYVASNVTYQVYEVGFNPGELPVVSIGTDLAACAEFIAKEFCVHENSISRHRARGIFVKGSDGSITNNRIDGSTAGAIVAGPEFGPFYEASFCHSLNIEGNVISNVGRKRLLASQPGAISISVTGPSTPQAPFNMDVVARDNGSIRIANNIVARSGQCGIFVGSAHETVITENVILGCQRMPWSSGGASGYGLGIDDLTAIIHIENSESVLLRGNLVESIETTHPAFHASAGSGPILVGSLFDGWLAGFELGESDEVPTPFDQPLAAQPPGMPKVRVHNGVVLTFDGFGLLRDPNGPVPNLAVGGGAAYAVNDQALLTLDVASLVAMQYDIGMETLAGDVLLLVAIDPLDGGGPIVIEALVNDPFTFTAPAVPHWRTFHADFATVPLTGGARLYFYRSSDGASTGVYLDDILLRR